MGQNIYSPDPPLPFTLCHQYTTGYLTSFVLSSYSTFLMRVISHITAFFPVNSEVREVPCLSLLMLTHTIALSSHPQVGHDFCLSLPFALFLKPKGLNFLSQTFQNRNNLQDDCLHLHRAENSGTWRGRPTCCSSRVPRDRRCSWPKGRTRPFRYKR